jgi:putative MATE family efflux protein
MSNVIDLKKDRIDKAFFHYLLPAISGLVVKSIFIIVDSIFIGRGVGPTGLAALAITLPFFTLFTAIAMMVGIGGAAKMSIQFGKGDFKSGQSLFFQSMAFITLVNLTLVTLTLVFLEDLLIMMGASGELLSMSVDYMSIILLFFYIFGPAWVLSCFIRNDTNPKLAMYAMMFGAVLNIVLDYLFIFEFHWGIKGGALATGISQVVIFGVLLLHFLHKKGKLKLKWQTLGFDAVPSILRSGLPIFFTESATAVTILIFNFVLLATYSDSHVAAFSIIANLGVVVIFLMVGIGQACQPIISFNYGAGLYKRVQQTFVLGLKYSIGAGLLTTVIVFVWSTEIAASFIEHDTSLIELTSDAMLIYFIAPIFIGVNMMTATLFQSIESDKQATAISLSRGIVFVVIGIFTLPILFPVKGIWASILFAEIITFFLSTLLLFKFNSTLASKPNSTSMTQGFNCSNTTTNKLHEV